jgi:hypothetical protein
MDVHDRSVGIEMPPMDSGHRVCSALTVQPDKTGAKAIDPSIATVARVKASR